jgi:peptide/nickel transport system permease protein
LTDQLSSFRVSPGYAGVIGGVSGRVVLTAQEQDQIVGISGEEVNGVVLSQPGVWEHPLGTDKQGRDILSRIIYGARVSLAVAIISIAIAGVIGTALGLVAGYFGGNVDHLVMRTVDIFLSIPGILLALVLAVALGPSFQTVIIVVVAIFWSRYARLVRGETLSLKS